MKHFTENRMWFVVFVMWTLWGHTIFFQASEIKSKIAVLYEFMKLWIFILSHETGTGSPGYREKAQRDQLDSWAGWGGGWIWRVKNLTASTTIVTVILKSTSGGAETGTETRNQEINHTYFLPFFFLFFFSHVPLGALYKHAPLTFCFGLLLLDSAPLTGFKHSLPCCTIQP